ncbi:MULTISPECIES: (d)CMP kinase [Thermoanaerobacterium]|uniref:(d)CMP kinase n=1 Tax=Thermoanaerobacterium TaxID=28895 RepID=UPI0022821858|nr:(d)CMP kinase [Thermoanaerobacterium xylanolyticum]
MRGAITTENTKEAIFHDTISLIDEIFRINKIKSSDVISIFFTATKDIDAAYPAEALRHNGISNIPMMCFQEMNVKKSLEKCIRVVVFINCEDDKEVKHIYMKNAKLLRLDLLNIKVAIDGPAGAGKSTVAKELAKKLNFTYIDTGAMYRALTYKVAIENINLEDKNKIVELASKIDIDLKNDKVLLDGMDVTSEIRTPSISEKVSYISMIPEVREIMVKLQKRLSDKGSVVMDGRDIATVVMPDAQFKFFLTASPEIRAMRRYNELTSKKIPVKYDDILNDIKKRDKNDTERDVAPLKKADDSIVIDTTNMSIDEVVSKMYNIIANG